MAIKTITAANSIYMLAIAGVYPTPTKLEGYAADAAFASDDIAPAETVMGVDGNMSAGYLPYMTIQTISIMPDSDSLKLFEGWLIAMNTAKEIFYAAATISLPSIGRKYTLTKGVLTAAKQIPEVKKVIQAATYKITWNTVAASPI
jgi:hypothetical protein